MITRAKRRRYITRHLTLLVALLLIIIAALAFVFYSNYRAQLHEIATKPVNADGAIGIAIDDSNLNIAVQQRLEDSLSRPLLMSTRRPYEPPKPKQKPVAKAEPPPPEQPPEIGETLASVIIIGERKVAFISGAEGTTRLEEGMTYKKWAVSEITSDSLTLTFNNQEKVLQLRTFATVAPLAPMRQLGEQKEKN